MTSRTLSARGRRGGAVATAALSALLLALPWAACSDSGGSGGGEPGGTGDDNGGFGLGESADIDFDPPDTLRTIIDSALSVGDQLILTTQIIDAGEDPLQIKEIFLEYTVPVGATDGSEPAFEIITSPELPTIVQPIGSDEYPQGVEVRIRYTKQADDTKRTAELVVKSSALGEEESRITFETESGFPALNVSPGSVDFGLVPDGETHEETLQLLNTGERTLMVSGFQITKDGRFGVKGEDFEIGGQPSNPLAVDLPTAIGVPAGESWPVTVTFTSDSPSPSEGNLLVFSDDPNTGAEGYLVPLSANKSGPCILVEPREINYGGKLVGVMTTVSFAITSCGTEPLTISELALTGDSSQDFFVDYSGMPAPVSTETGPSPITPLVIPINETVDIPVAYIPDEVNPKDADNVAIPDLGRVLVASDAFESVVEVELIGAGAEEDCPTPIIDVAEGEEVIPETVLHLDGTQSYAPFGAVVKYNWKVTEPDGSQGKFVPTPSDSSPIFEVNVVGLYTFELEVWDANNNKSCNPAVLDVIVQPDQALHVELTWVTPSDLDETDEGEGVGTDLDLHFTHPNATGPDLDKDGSPDPWFDQEWDCFWYNPNPNWGSFDPFTDDDPSLDRDDTDGAGPENLNLGIPEGTAENPFAYQIAAHYWDDHAFEGVLASIRVWTYATKIYEVVDQPLSERDLWCVGSVTWPDPVVTPCGIDGAEKIVPDYVNPFFFTPF